MAVIGFQQDPSGPPGMGMFHFDNGQSLYGHNPDAAAQLNPQVAQAATAPQPYLAQNAPNASAAPPMASDAGPNASPAPPDQGGGYSPAGPPAANSSQASPMSVASGQGGAPAPAAPAGQAAPASAVPMDPSMLQRAAVDAYVNRPTARTAARFVPKSRKESFEGAGTPFTPEEEQHLNDLYGQQEAVKLSNAAAQISQNDATIKAAQERQFQLALKQQYREDQLETARQDFDRKWSDVQGDIDQANLRHPNPNRYFQERGTWGQIGLALMQGIAQFGASFNHTENPVTHMIDGMVARDVASQSNDIEQGKTRANNKLQELMAKYKMDLPEAQQALTIAQQKLADNQAMQLAASTNNQQIRSQVSDWYSQREIERADKLRELRNQAAGKRAGTVELAYQGAGGGEPTEAQKQSRLGTLEKQADVYNKLGIGPGTDKDTREDAKDLAKTEKEDVAAQTAMEPLRNLTQKYKGEDIPGWGFFSAHAPQRALSKEQRENQQTIELAIPQIAIAMYGRGAERNQQLLETISEQMKGIRSAEDLDHLLTNFDHTIAARRKSLRSGYATKVVDTVDKRGGYQPTELPDTAERVGE